MGIREAFLIVIIILLHLPLIGALDVISRYNASDYEIKMGSLSAGILGNTNASDSVSFDTLQGTNMEGMAVVSINQTTRWKAETLQWLGNGWGTLTAASSEAATPGAIQWIDIDSSPVRDEKVMVTLDNLSDIDAQVWNGEAWGATTQMTAVAAVNTKRAFDVEYEKLSGDALVAYVNTTVRKVHYNIWNGNSWTGTASIDLGGTATAHNIVDMYPRPNSDEIMLLVSDVNTTPALYAVLWTGSAFNMSTIVNVTSRLDTTSDDQSWDGAWEELSGDFNVFYSDDIRQPLYYRSFSGGAWTVPLAATNTSDGDNRYVKMARFPGTDRQMICSQETTATDFNCQNWNGTQITGWAQDAAMEAGAVGRNFDVAPMLNTDGGFIAMYGDSNDDWFDFLLCTSAANCDAGTFVTRTLWAATVLNGTDTRWGQIYADPYNYGNFTLLGVSQTAAGGWYKARIYCNAATCYSTENWTRFAASPRSNAVTSVVYDSASFSYDAYSLYRSEIWHNSSSTDGGNVSYVNVSAKINSTVAANYSLNIFNWVSGAWNTCQEVSLVANTYTNLVCNMSVSPNEYRSQDDNKFIRIALNGTYNTTTQGILATDYLQYIIAFTDRFPFYDTGANNLGVTNSTPMPGQNITFFSLWYERVALSQHWLEQNSSGSFQLGNSFAFSFENNSWANLSLIVPGSAEGKQFNARIYANDSINQINYTTNITVTVEDVAPAVGNMTVNATAAMANSFICVNVSATDIGIGIDEVWVLVTYPNGITANVSLSDTGCNAGGIGDDIYGTLIATGTTVGNLTINTTFANDSRNNMNGQFPFPQLDVFISYPANAIGGSNAYVGFYGNATSSIINQNYSSATLYLDKIRQGTMYIVPSLSTVSWDKLKRADNTTDMPAIDAQLGLSQALDKLETYFTQVDPTQYTSRGGMASFQLSATATTAQYQEWTGSGWENTGSASTPPVTAGTVQFTRIRASPIRDEKILATLDSNSDIDAQVWDGAQWSATTEMTAVAAANNMDVIDVAYERLTGNALLVYANTTVGTINYRTWNGSEFSRQYGFGIGIAGSTNRILDLFPRENTDEIMLLLSNANTTPELYAILWQNGTFNFSTQIRLTSYLDTSSDYQSYFGDWEERSGDFNAFYGENTALTIFRRSFENGAWTDAQVGGNGANGDVRFLRANTFPGTDNQMVCWKEWTAGDVNCQYWNGTEFGTRFSNDTTEIGAVARNFDVQPLLSTNGGFVLIFGYNNADWLDFMVCNSGTNCKSGTYQARSLWSTAQMGGVDTSWTKMFADPNNPGNLTILATSQTAANGWYRGRIYCDENSCVESEPWTGFGATTSAAFDLGSFTFDKHKLDYGTRPTCGIDNTNYLLSSDGNFKIGSLYSDEDDSGAFNLGDNIIFCADFNINKPDAFGTTSDFEIVFPKVLADNVDAYIEA